jgi:hypothetical protein
MKNKSTPSKQINISGFYLLILFSLLIANQSTQAQAPFIKKCLGTWQGTMHIYGQGQLRDTVAVRLTVAATADTAAWTWRTEYLSAKMPMTKDYVLRTKDAAKGIYITDEGGGLELYDYLYNDKLYCVFETGGIMLTSSYEIRGDELIFEVTSGKKLSADHSEVTNYSTGNLQRVIFKKSTKP